MKKFLLPIMALALSNTIAMAQDPVFPESFGVTLSSEGLTVTQGVDQDVYTISITGECEADELTVTFAVPEGWDGFMGMTDEGYDPGVDPLRSKASRAEESEWVPVEMLEAYGLKEGNSLTFKVDGEPHFGQLYLCLDELADAANQIAVEVNVTKKEAAAEPTFPESFGVTLSDQNLTVTQGVDMGVYTIAVSGESAVDEFTLSIAVPEGWTGFIGLTDSDYDPWTEPLHSKASRSEDPEWIPVEGLLEFGMKEGNVLTFKVDGEEHYGQLYLYWNDMADYANQIAIEVNVTKKEAAAEPVFPASFDVTVSDEALAVTQGVDQGVYTIAVSGESTADEFTLSVAVPEGWTGFIGMTDSDYDPWTEPLHSKASRSEDPEWIPVEGLLEFGMKEGNVLTFKVDGEEHYGQLYLYWNDMADYANQIAIEVNVTKKAGEPVFPASFDVTVSDEALTVTQGVDMGVYTISVTGESVAPTYTVTVAVPEGWDGFIGMTDEDFNPEIEPLRSKAADMDEEPKWAPIESLMAYGFKKTNSFTFTAGDQEHFGQLYLYLNDEVYLAETISVEVSVTKNINGIDAVTVDGATPRYFDLLGAEVVNPTSGVYVKIANGKASKVFVK